ncbi:MAG TPA: DUF4239 domain-containing protein [Candidatus Binatia bacterium]|jgi:hypothetical protein|nr:DUF4239 domain-containing protein [Candidatus Binatia bacterium]
MDLIESGRGWDSTIVAWSFSLALFVGMLISLEIGWRIGRWRRARDPEGATAGIAAVDGAVFGLLGLLLAFSFSGAATRFDARRELIVQEVNAIGTAWLRLDLLSASAQTQLRDQFRAYLDSRIKTYDMFPNIAAAETEYARSVTIQQSIWTNAVAASSAEGSPATMLLLPALNDMFDVTTTRTAAMRMHPPPVIFAMLFALALASAMLAGYGMAGAISRSWLHVLGFVLAMAAAVYVILDVEFPRLGLIRISTFDQYLRNLRASFH